MGPRGDFTLHSHPAAKYLFISAGSGITPMMSMLRWLNDCAPWTDVAFVNCARRPEEIIFRKELELLGTQHARPVARLPDRGALDAAQSWFGHMGRIDAVQACRCWRPIFSEREVFCCGPDRSCAPCAACWKPPAST